MPEIAERFELPCVCGSNDAGPHLVIGTSRQREPVDIRPCKTCGLARTFPGPPLDLVKQQIYSTEDGFRDQIRFMNRFRGGPILDPLERIVNSGGKRLLDVGCGIGQLLVAARSRGWDVSGIEFNDKAAQYGRDIFGLSISSRAVESYGSENEKFDAVTLRHVLEHLEKPHETIASLVKLLKPGGALAVEVPNMAGFYPQILRAWWYGYGVSQHLWHFTPHTIEIIAKLAGCRVTHVSSRICLDYPGPLVLRRLTDLPGQLFNWGDDMVVVFTANS